jgi:hypothetical protein
MATRSNIGAIQEDGTIKAIYCHWDGYPEHVGATLAEHYDSPAKVAELLNLGDISSLGEDVSTVESYASRGETGTGARTYKDQEDWKQSAEDSGCEFLYLYQKNWKDEYVWAWYSIYNIWNVLPKKVMA